MVKCESSTGDMGKVAQKPRRLQWGPKPNTFTCGRCKSPFRVRAELRAHRAECTVEKSRERRWLKDCKIRIGSQS